MSFVSVKLIIVSFGFNISFITFFLAYFFNFKLFFIFFGNSFSWYVPTTYSPLRWLIIYVHGTTSLNFSIKKIFRPTWSVTFCKNIFIFWYSNNITNFKFRIFIIIFFINIESIYTFDFASAGFILIVLW